MNKLRVLNFYEHEKFNGANSDIAFSDGATFAIDTSGMNSRLNKGLHATTALATRAPNSACHRKTTASSSRISRHFLHQAGHEIDSNARPPRRAVWNAPRHNQSQWRYPRQRHGIREG